MELVATLRRAPTAAAVRVDSGDASPFTNDVSTRPDVGLSDFLRSWHRAGNRAAETLLEARPADTPIVTRWAEAGRSHAGGAIVVRIDHREFGRSSVSSTPP
jgi:hypothetical protein